MRKMTYTQAATCGENLKVRVTPEQSEKMQKAWFAAGKRWQNNHTNIVINPEKTCLFLDGDLLSNGDDYDFEQDENEEIELIDKPQHDFASQQEVWVWLAEGNKVKRGDYVIGFKDGVLWNFTKNKCEDYYFDRPEAWKKHTPTRLIRVNGVEVPAPLESLDGLETIYITCCSTPQYPIEKNVDSACRRQQDLSLCYATKEDAIKRAEAMLKFEVVE